MWELRAQRRDDPPIEERVDRQGTAWRVARRLFAAGYTITAVQYSVEDPPVPMAAYQFDGIRFVRLQKL